MSRASIGFPSGMAMQFETAGRAAAVAVARYRQGGGDGALDVLATRLEELAAQLRRRELVGPDAVESVLWSCAGYLLSTRTPQEPIPVTARAIADEDVPAHQVSEDEDLNEQGL